MDVRAYDWVAKHALRYPRKRVCIDIDGGRELSYAELDDRARRLAAFLSLECGLAKGERIAILAHNCADYVVVQTACAKTGAIMVPLNWRLAVPELAYQLGNSRPRILIYGTDFESAAHEAGRDCGISHLLDFGADGTAGTYAQGIREHAAASDPAELYQSDPWAILYTSGTSGFPKGAITTHGMAFYNAVNFGLVVNVTRASTSLCTMPLFHTGGLNNNVNVTIAQGGTVVLCRQFDPGVVLRLIADPDLAITHVFGVPATYQTLTQHPDFENTDLSRIVSASVGGSPVPLSQHRFWRDHGVSFQEGYGLTEGGPSVLISDLDQPLEKVGSTGKPVVHGDVRLVDRNGEDVADDATGEIWIKGPSVTPGYWNNVQATENAFTDGWFRTGDAARRDGDGYYYIVDRWKDMFISGGENVYPAEVENVLFEIDELSEVAVIGITDERWGEVGCAAVVLKPGARLSAEHILRHCDGRLARFKIPKSVVFLDSLPRNAMNKVLKGELREQLGAGNLIQK